MGRLTEVPQQKGDASGADDQRERPDPIAGMLKRQLSPPSPALRIRAREILQAQGSRKHHKGETHHQGREAVKPATRLLPVGKGEYPQEDVGGQQGSWNCQEPVQAEQQANQGITPGKTQAAGTQRQEQHRRAQPVPGVTLTAQSPPAKQAQAVGGDCPQHERDGLVPAPQGPQVPGRCHHGESARNTMHAQQPQAALVAGNARGQARHDGKSQKQEGKALDQVDVGAGKVHVAAGSSARDERESPNGFLRHNRKAP